MSGTQVQPPRPKPGPIRMHGRPPSWLLVVLVGAIGFTAGIVVAIAARGSDHTKTVTVTRAPAKTVPARKSGTPPTVIQKVQVPDFTNVRLDVAKSQIHAQQWHVKVKGGGLFGVVVDSHWTVVAQDPRPGTYLQRGGTITVDVVK